MVKSWARSIAHQVTLYITLRGFPEQTCAVSKHFLWTAPWLWSVFIFPYVCISVCLCGLHLMIFDLNNCLRLLNACMCLPAPVSACLWLPVTACLTVDLVFCRVSINMKDLVFCRVSINMQNLVFCRVLINMEDLVFCRVLINMEDLVFCRVSYLHLHVHLAFHRVFFSKLFSI